MLGNPGEPLSDADQVEMMFSGIITVPSPVKTVIRSSAKTCHVNGIPVCLEGDEASIIVPGGYIVVAHISVVSVQPKSRN